MGSPAMLSAGGLLGGLWRGSSPPSRGMTELLGSYSTSPWLRVTVQRMSDAVASNKIQVAQKVKGGNPEDGDPDHPLAHLLARWNPTMSGHAGIALTQTYLDLAGEAFIIIERDQSGNPIELWPVAPSWVKSTPSTESGPYFEFTAKQWRQKIPEDDVIWLRHLDPRNPYGRGSGIGATLGDEIDTDEYAAKHTKSWFYNRAVPDILVGVDGASQEQLNRAKQQWEDAHRGPQRAYGSHWHNGNLQIQTISQTFQEQQLVELRSFERNAIIQTYGVPPEIVGVIENSNRATITGAEYIFQKQVVWPRLRFLASELQAKLGDPQNAVIWFWNPVPSDQDYALEVAKAAPFALTINEWRDMAGLEPIDDGEKFFVPNGGLFSDERVADVDGAKSKATFKGVTDADIDLIVDAMDPIELEREIAPHVTSLIEDWGKLTLAEVEASVSFNMISSAVLAHIDQVSGEKIVGINSTTRDQIRRQLLQGVLEGEGIESLARRVESTFDQISRGRARVIARTEVLNSSNFARTEAFKQSGLVDKHRWLATLDTRVRDTHKAMHNQVQPLGKEFTANGKSAKRPGDFTEAGENINCRCITVPVIEPIEVSADIDRQKQGVREMSTHTQLVRKMDLWEARYLRALKRAFSVQRDAVLAELKRVSQ